MIALQNKYRDQIRELTENLVSDLTREIYPYLTTINSHSSLKELEENQNADIFNKIGYGTVFKEINIGLPKLTAVNIKY